MSACLLTSLHFANAQEQTTDPGQIHGNVSLIFQQFNPDTLIRAVVPSEETAMSAYTNLIYSRGNFRAGVRYESYLDRLPGYPQEFEGSGIGYRFASFQNDELGITVGNFYDQFGNGLVFRSYQEPTLGIDNAIDGMLVTLKPHKGVYIKGLYGKMRVGFDSRIINSDGIVRGVDGEVNLNDVIPKMADIDHRLNLGFSFVSKYQQDDDANLVLPENVGAWAYRANYIYKGFQLNAEYATKINDPSFDNFNIYKPGEALMINTSYSTKGFGIGLDYKYNDNMSYRINRNAKLTNALIGYVPSLNRPHTYNLAATLYPYAVQLNGEVAYQANMSYKFPRGSTVGGKYGATLTLNYSAAYNLDSTANHGNSNPNFGYESNFLMPGNDIYFTDVNVEFKKKFNKKFKATFMYLHFIFNNDIMQAANDNEGTKVKGNIISDIGIVDLNYKINKKHNIRAEFQALFTQEHLGDWATLVVEYTYSPHWFVAFVDQYNFGNSDDVYRIHYMLGNIGYINGSNRITIGYGKQREGLFCVGGVCRVVPASNGFTLTVSTTF